MFFCTQVLLKFGHGIIGVANGKIQDSPRRQDPCLKIQDWDLKVSTKSEPETVRRKPSSRLHFAKMQAGFENCLQPKINKYKSCKSRVPKCHAMTTNLWLKNPTCRSCIFKRLLLCVFYQINNFIMVSIKTVGQKSIDLAAKNSRIRDARKHKKMRFRDSFKTPLRFRDLSRNFRDPEFSRYHSPPLIIYACGLHFPSFFSFTVLCEIWESVPNKRNLLG